tara:strand:- start:581 stop:682 length:102 start_codon:yes stop_codon:yes gene_type:complete
MKKFKHTNEELELAKVASERLRKIKTEKEKELE